MFPLPLCPYNGHMATTRNRNTLKAADILRTANIAGLTPRQVRRIVDGTNKNPKILRLYETLSAKTATYDKKLKVRYDSEA